MCLSFTSNKLQKGVGGGGGAQNRHNIIVDHKPTKETRQTCNNCYIHPMGQGHKPPCDPYTKHLSNTQWSQSKDNHALWRTSVCTHFEPNNANIVQKFTPSIFFSSLASDNLLSSEKN